MLSKTHELNWPIKDNKGANLTKVTVEMLTVQQHKDIADEFKLEDISDELLHQMNASKEGSSDIEDDPLGIEAVHFEISPRDKKTINERARAFVAKSTGLSILEINRLVMPDYTSIKSIVSHYINVRATKLDKELKEGGRTKLIVPIEASGEKVTSYKLIPPTVEATCLMDEYDDNWDKTLFLSCLCTQLTREQLIEMSMPDYNSLQDDLVDFLGKPADYFRQKTLKT